MSTDMIVPLASFTAVIAVFFMLTYGFDAAEEEGILTGIAVTALLTLVWPLILILGLVVGAVSGARWIVKEFRRG